MRKCSKCDAEHSRKRPECGDCEAVLKADYYNRKSDVRKAYAKQHNDKLRQEVFTHYGGACTCCHEKETKFLAIDHIEGNPDKRYRGGRNLYLWLRKNSFPTGFQVLCHNCNFSKGMYGTCPHQVGGHHS